MASYFHQTNNSVGESVFNIHTFENFTHHLHFHKSFEIAYVVEAHTPIECSVGKNNYLLQKSDFVIILPYEIHSFYIPKGSKLWIVVFSAEYVKTFSKSMSDMRGETSVFHCDNVTEEYVNEQLIKKTEVFSGQPSEPFAILIKSCLYAMCHNYLQNVPLINKGKGYDSVTGKILNCISEHFKEDISLKDVSDILRYNYQYLSRIFNQTMGVNFKTLLNHYRFEYAKQLLTETDKNISEIAFESGFQSIRSFNRICIDISKKTPNEIRGK